MKLDGDDHLGDVAESVSIPLCVLDTGLTRTGGTEGVTSLLLAHGLQLLQVGLVVPVVVVEGPDEGLEAWPGLTGLLVLEVEAVAGLVGGLGDGSHPGVPVALLHLRLRAGDSPADGCELSMTIHPTLPNNTTIGVIFDGFLNNSKDLR